MLLTEYDELTEAMENAKTKKAEILEKLVKLAKDKNSKICGRSLSKTEKKGSIAYAKVVKEHCKDVDLEEYRGKSSEFWVLR